jgi:Peptidase family M28
MPNAIAIEDAEYALGMVKRICTQVGPGVPCSTQEHSRAEIIRKEMEAILGDENVNVEEFTLAPGAFLGAPLVSTTFMCIAFVLNMFLGRVTLVSPWISSILAMVFSLSAVSLFILEFVFGFELIDPFFEHKTSINVIGSLRKSGTTYPKRLLLLSGHHDSAYEFTWLRHAGYGFFILLAVWMFSLAIILVISIIQLVGVMMGNADLVRLGMVGWILVVFPVMPSIIFAVFYIQGRGNGGTVPGAADNLSACGIVLSMCRFLVNNPSYIPEDLEIRFITFGSEEAGVRGSKRYVQRHMHELESLDARELNYETIVNPEIAILSSESSGSVRNSPELVKSVAAAAQRASIPYKIQPATLGTSNDAGPFSKAGLKATTILGFTAQQMVAFYHQRNDCPEVLSIDALLNVLKLTFEWIRNRGE